MDRPFKPIVFSDHSQTQMKERGATREEVIEAIKYGEEISAKHKRQAYRKNFQSDCVAISWIDHFVILREQSDRRISSVI